MVARKLRESHKGAQRPPFDHIALVLQGGGALGAYQCGVYQALSEADLVPDWLAGISIGAINAAIIAGNAPENRVQRLRAFWELITATPGVPPMMPWLEQIQSWALHGDAARQVFGQASATTAMISGAPGFFAPRLPPPWLQPSGTLEATSYYDTAPLKSTLERLIDFDRINAGATRFSVGAVNVQSGNFAYFDTTTHRIRVEHIMASGALPPGFPAIEIDGEFYWDGGLVSNTPLAWVVDADSRQDTLTFQVDLWSARGDVPKTLADVSTRQKEIVYSSRTREQTDRWNVILVDLPEPDSPARSKLFTTYFYRLVRAR